MRIYLASAYSRRLEMLGYSADLIGLGHEVTSTWTDGHHERGRGAAIDGEASIDERADWAREDIEDVERCDLLILFTDEGSKRNRGGKDFEAGYAMALGRQVWVVGPFTHVFTCLPRVRHFEGWADCLAGVVEESRGFPAGIGR